MHADTFPTTSVPAEIVSSLCEKREEMDANKARVFHVQSVSGAEGRQTPPATPAGGRENCDA
eukprot:3532949-Pyramimonas_sp.AAC.1